MLEDSYEKAYHMHVTYILTASPILTNQLGMTDNECNISTRKHSSDIDATTCADMPYADIDMPFHTTAYDAS